MNTEQIIRELDRIARKNKDRWGYKFTVTPRHASIPGGGLKWDFECFEEAEGHTMIAAAADNPETAVQKAFAGLPDSLKDWGYST